MTQVIAKREFQVKLKDGSIQEAHIEIHAPEMKDEEGETWQCQVSVVSPKWNLSKNIYGVDAFQALSLATGFFELQMGQLAAMYGQTIRIFDDCTLPDYFKQIDASNYLTNVDTRLFHKISSLIHTPGLEKHDDLALPIFKRQFLSNTAYRTFCKNSSASFDSVADWREIPAIPARAFKLADLSCMPVDRATVVFYSSGTTEENHSKHYMDASAEYLYKESLGKAFDKFVGQDLDIIALMPSPREASHSSLSYMLGALGAKEFHWGDPEALAARLIEICSVGKPICLFGTAFAFIELFDSSDRDWKLPEGSKVVETGGFKGRTREVGKDELYAMFEARLGTPLGNCIAEYGMSEMSSQFYDIGRTGFQAPHWLRWRVIDPVTLDDAEKGLLRVYDLANWNSVAVIQTQDMVQRLPGDRFELLGRASDADLRGCSLMVEDRWLSKSEA